MNDGGPAFPQTNETTPVSTTRFGPIPGGISSRDYFAAAALQGIIANGCLSRFQDHCADLAYQYADAMILRREK